MSARADLQRSVAAELESMGLTADNSLGKVQGRSGYSRDVWFEDVAAGFAGKLRIFSPDFVTVNFGQGESERWSSADDAISAIADEYLTVRQNADPVTAPAGAPVRLSQATAAPGQARVSKDDIEGVRAFLLGHARNAENRDERREFADAAVRLGATAQEVLDLVL